MGENVTEPRTARTVSPAPPHQDLIGRPRMDADTVTKPGDTERASEVGYRLKAIRDLIDRRDQVADDRLVCDQVIRLAAAAMEWC